MSARRLAQVVLLLVVAGALVMIFKPAPRDDAAEAVTADASVRQPQESAAVIAYYFHGNIRCETCRSIEAQAAEAVLNGFPVEVANGTLQWKVVNIDQPENEHFVKDFGLTHSTVVLVRTAEDGTMDYVALDRVWELIHENDGVFRQYIQDAVSQWLHSEA